MKGCYYPYIRTGKKTKAMASFLQGFMTKLKASSWYSNSRTLVLVLFDEGRIVSKKNQVQHSMAAGEGTGRSPQCCQRKPSMNMTPLDLWGELDT